VITELECRSGFGPELTIFAGGGPVVVILYKNLTWSRKEILSFYGAG